MLFTCDIRTASVGNVKQFVASVHLCIRLFPLYLLNQLVFAGEFLYVYVS